MIYVFLSLGTFSVGAFLYKRVKSMGAYSLILKIISSLLFIGVAVAGLLTQTLSGLALNYAVLFLCGLMFGLLGDIFLDLKMMYPKDSDIYTFSGMASFAIGHIFYIFATIMYFGFELWSLALFFAVTLLILIAIKFLKLNIGKFWIPVVIYTILLSFLASNSFFIMINNFSTVTAFVFFGALSFLVSDLILSMTYFKGKTGKAYAISNHILYYLAQFALALSIMFLV